MGTNYIAPTWRQPENLNKDRLSNYSINFNETSVQNEYINFPSTNFLNNEQASFSFWIKPDTYAGVNYGYFFSGATSAQGGIAYSEGSNSGAYYTGVLYWYSGSSSVILDVVVTENVWNHIVVVFDGTSIKTYKDGSLGSTKTITPPTSLEYNTIGRYTPANTHYVEGCLAQMCVFNYALTDGTNGTVDQINYLYNLNNPLTISGAEPIAYWPLGDNSNPTATAGYPNIVSAADSVFDFAASNEEIDAPGPYADGTQGDLTISAWVKQDSITSSYRPFICTGFTTSMTQPQIAMALRNVGGNRLYLFYNGGGGSNYIYAQNVMTQANKWYHCAFVRSGSTGKLYVDGQEVSTLNSADFSTDPAVTTADSEITLGGWRYSGSNESLNGELSNVCLWKTALTDGVGGQIEELYNNGLPLLELPEIPQNNNLLAWYKLNQSAILTPGFTGTPWQADKIGNPDVSGSGDYAQVVADESTGVLNFRCQDLNSDLTNYFLDFPINDGIQWLTPNLTGSKSNVTVVVDTRVMIGSNSFDSAGSQLFTSLDGGAWVSRGNKYLGPGDGSGTWQARVYTINNLSYSSSIRLRLDMGTGTYSTSRVEIRSVSITSGSETIYSETFSGQSGKGWSGGVYSAPNSTTLSADKWDIPDNRSAYPQSFEFDGIDDLITLNKPSGWEDNQVHCVSLWIKNEDSGIGYVINNRGGSSVAPGFSFIVNGTSTGYIFSNTVTSKIATGYQAALKIPNDGEWHHVLWTHQPITNILKAYINGVYKYTKTGSVGTDATPSIGALIGNSGGAPWKGKISNIMLWEQIVLSDGNVSLSNPASGQVAEVYNNGIPLPTTSVEPSNLKAWYKLDNTANYIDSPQNLTFTPDYWSVDPANITPGATEALNFSGGYQNLPGKYEGIEFNDTPLTDNKFIMSCWYNSTKATNDNGYIYHNYSGGTISIAFTSNEINVYANPATVGGQMVRYYLPATRTGWHHLVIYMNQGSGSTVDLSNTDNLKIYIDGSELSVGIVLGDVTAAPVRTEADRLGIDGGGNFEGFQWSNWALLVGDNAVLTAVPTLYNGGTPGDISSLNPTWWYKLNSSDISFPTSTPPTTADNVFTLTDSSGNGNTTTGPFYFAKNPPNQKPSIQTVNVVTQQGISSGMTEANLIDDNVSTVNGESDTLPGTALVQSDLTRKLPFSNYSVLFNGVDESFNCGPGFQYTDITVSCWLKFETFTNYDRVYQTGISGGGIGFLLVFLTDGGGNKLNAVWGNPTEESVVSNIDIALDTWYNVLWTRNSNEIKMYIDGADVSGGTNVSWSYGSGNDLELGRKPGGGNNFDGDLSNMAIWNSVLTQEEILDVYNNGVPTNLNTSFTPGQPEYWWPMDEDHTYFNGSVLIARDAVGSTDATGVNIIQENIVGNAPGSTANGVGSNLTIADLKGDMQNSTNNSYSINMADYADGVTNPANSGRSTNVP